MANGPGGAAIQLGWYVISNWGILTYMSNMWLIGLLSSLPYWLALSLFAAAACL